MSRVIKNGGFTGGRRRQGGWITAALGLVGSLWSSSKANSAAKAADPYAKYRDAAAQRLNALMANPSSIQSTPEWKARLMGAERTMASQGYTGSGNALVAAAEAGASVYQQAFSNLGQLAGAFQSPATAVAATQGARDTQASAQAGIVNNLTNLAEMYFNRPAATPPPGG